MSGHSKWSSIKHKKAATDAKRGKLFSKLVKEITVAAKEGGGDPDANPRLRTAIAAAKGANMPGDNIEKAVKKGTGELPGVTYEQSTYEGYGPGGVAIMIDVLTDNRNRMVAEIRHLLDRKGGHLGESGCVAWMFTRRGLIIVPAESIEEDELLEVALECGAEDVVAESENYEVYTEPHELMSVRDALDEKGVTVTTAELTMQPKSTIRLDGKDAERTLALMEDLEDHDDVQSVHANFDIEDEVLAQFAEG